MRTKLSKYLAWGNTPHPAKAAEVAKVNQWDGSTPPTPQTGPLPDAGMGKRRQAVLTMLEQNPEIEYAWVASGATEPVRIHLAVRGKGACELTIAAVKWDEFKFLELLERQGSYKSNLPP